EHHPGALASIRFGDPFADSRAAAGDDHQPVLETRIDRSAHRAPPSRPREARLRISPPTPRVQGGAWSQVVTRFSSTPRRGEDTRTRSPTLWVKPPPGASRSSMGA